MGDFKVRSSNQALRGSKQASTRRWPALRGEGRSGEGRARRRNTVSAVLDQFMKCHARKLRSADRVKKALDDYPVIGSNFDMRLKVPGHPRFSRS
jgi:hypothetical protein